MVEILPLFHCDSAAMEKIVYPTKFCNQNKFSTTTTTTTTITVTTVIETTATTLTTIVILVFCYIFLIVFHHIFTQ